MVRKLPRFGINAPSLVAGTRQRRCFASGDVLVSQPRGARGAFHRNSSGGHFKAAPKPTSDRRKHGRWFVVSLDRSTPSLQVALVCVPYRRHLARRHSGPAAEQVYGDLGLIKKRSRLRDDTNPRSRAAPFSPARGARSISRSGDPFALAKSPIPLSNRWKERSAPIWRQTVDRGRGKCPTS